MDYNKAKELLEKYGQEQLLRYYDELNDDRKASLLKQIEGIDFSLLDLIKDNSEAKKGVITPLDSAVTIEDIEKTKKVEEDVVLEKLKAEFKEQVATPLIAKAKEEYVKDMSKSTQKSVERTIVADANTIIEKQNEELKKNQKK